MARASKPGPRLALDPGIRIVVTGVNLPLSDPDLRGLKNARKMDLVNPRRYLCSHLIRLLSGDSWQWANLDEIWETGAVLECEEPIQAGTEVRISAGDLCFPGTISAVEQHEFGWRAEVEFSPGTHWTIEQWSPEHALDPATLQP